VSRKMGRTFRGIELPAGEDVTQQLPLPPVYLSPWDRDFLEFHFEPSALRFMAATMSLFGTLAFIMDVTDPKDQAIGGVGWTWAAYSGELFAAVVSVVIFAIFAAPPLRAFNTTWYQVLCWFWLLSVGGGWMVMMFVVEHRRSVMNLKQVLYGNVTIVHSPPNYTAWAGLPDGRQCFDSDPATTLKAAREYWEPGCLCSMLGSGGSLGLHLAGLLGMPLLRLRPSVAAYHTTTMCSLFIVLSVLAGWSSWNFAATLILLSCTGMFATRLCDQQWKGALQEYAMRARILIASEQQRRLLGTLIPRNILDNLELARGAKHISMCMVMFCRVELLVETRQDLERLDKLIRKFDRCVEQSGMYKYQHVCTGESFYYIVGCDRMACPYDTEVQSHPYPLDTTWRVMTRLASTLTYLADDTCNLHFGLSSGPVAGIVLGNIRRFYCIYGDALNEAARMCALAAAGQILAPSSKLPPTAATSVPSPTSEVGCGNAQHGGGAEGEAAHGILARPLGVFDVKGKGQMELSQLEFVELGALDADAVETCGVEEPGADGRRRSLASFSSLAFEDLETEVRAVAARATEWTGNSDAALQEQHAMSAWWCCFTHEETEREYRAAQILADRRGLSCGGCGQWSSQAGPGTS
jgi:hypothetical protein